MEVVIFCLEKREKRFFCNLLYLSVSQENVAMLENKIIVINYHLRGFNLFFNFVVDCLE
jgi:hypothetical protein